MTSIFKTLEAEARKALDAVEAEAVNLASKFATIAEADLEAFFDKYFPKACALVLKYMGEEFNVLAGSEKQSEVVTHLVQDAEVLAHGFTSDLRVLAQTAAQQAYTTLASTVTAAKAD